MESDTLSSEEIQDLFGGEATPIKVDPDEMAVSLVLRSIRNQLADCAEATNVGVNQLARRLDVSPSSVSRFLNGEGDLRVSTAVLYARALGRAWNIALSQEETAPEKGNYRGHPEFMDFIVSTSNTTSTEAPFMVSDSSHSPTASALVGFMAYS